MPLSWLPRRGLDGRLRADSRPLERSARQHHSGETGQVGGGREYSAPRSTQAPPVAAVPTPVDGRVPLVFRNADLGNPRRFRLGAANHSAEAPSDVSFIQSGSKISVRKKSAQARPETERTISPRTANPMLWYRTPRPGGNPISAAQAPARNASSGECDSRSSRLLGSMSGKPDVCVSKCERSRRICRGRGNWKRSRKRGRRGTNGRVSTKSSAPKATMGLVIDATRKMASSRIGAAALRRLMAEEVRSRVAVGPPADDAGRGNQTPPAPVAPTGRAFAASGGVIEADGTRIVMDWPWWA